MQWWAYLIISVVGAGVLFYFIMGLIVLSLSRRAQRKIFGIMDQIASDDVPPGRSGPVLHVHPGADPSAVARAIHEHLDAEAKRRARNVRGPNAPR